MIFRDCLHCPIQIGDVLACGQRQGSHGGIRVGVVTGFTEKTILANMVVGDTWDRDEQRYTSWTLRKGHFSAGYNCFITGMSEAELRTLIGLSDEQNMPK